MKEWKTEQIVEHELLEIKIPESLSEAQIKAQESIKESEEAIKQLEEEADAKDQAFSELKTELEGKIVDFERNGR